MSNATWVQTNFNGGEWSPLAYGRFDIAKYKNGLETCQNYIPTQQGSLTRRPGTRYVVNTKNNGTARLQKFEFSTTQAYILEFGDSYIRVYANDGQIQVSSASAYVASATITLTLANPCVITWNSHGFSAGDPVAFTTSGSLPTAITAGTTYYVVNPTTNTFQIAATKGGTAISTAAMAQSGTHTGHKVYSPGDMVTSGGTYYLNIASSYGNTPPNATYWYAQPNAILEIPSPYVAADLFDLSFAQSADTLYIAHKKYAPRKLQRLGTYNWRLVKVNFIDGPYYGVNATNTKLAPSGGVFYNTPITVNASDTAGINGGAGFKSTDVGRQLRIKQSACWYFGTITGYTSPTQITWTPQSPVGNISAYQATATANISGGSVFSCTIQDGGFGYGATPPNIAFSGGGGSGAVAYAVLTNGVITGIQMSVTGTGYSSAPTVSIGPPGGAVGTATTFWRLGEWNGNDNDATSDYPAAVMFHQDRLVFAGSPSFPGRVDASNTGDYENFGPSGVDGTVTDSNALSFTLNSATVNAITWLISDENGMLIGTTGGEWVISPSGTQTAITPTNVNAKQLSNYGSATVSPLRVGKATLFIQRTGRKLRELFYQFTYNTFQAIDISLVGEHLTAGGIKQMALQLAPQQLVWFARKDGSLVAMTYDKDQDIVGWHPHPLGGYSNAGRTAGALVESVATIPAPGILRDEVWLVVNRYINGATVRTVEVMSKMWEDGDTTAAANFLDCSAEYNSTPTTTISGLTWLEGQTVGVLTDGAVHPDRTVTGGAISLDWSASRVQIGLKYKSRAKTLRMEAGGADGPSQGKMKRIHRAVVRFFQSVGLSMGSDSPGVIAYPEPFRSSADLMTSPIALFNGDKRWSYEGTWAPEGQVFVETNDPLPSNITMLMVQLDTQDAT